MPDKTNSLTIGRLASAAKVHVETIRYYQGRRLLPEPERPPDEISDLLQLEVGIHRQEASALAGHKLRDVREKNDRLGKIEKVLDEMVDRYHTHPGNITCALIASLHQGIREAGD